MPANSSASVGATSTDSCIDEVSKVYGIANWGFGYFGINSKGHLTVAPHRIPGLAIDVFDVVCEQVRNQQALPLLLRFPQILDERLAALHEAGYLHGDVKPSNVGFTANGLPKLLDFGLARGPHDARITGGTLRYLSPEVLDGQPAAEADDVWSLCVVLYEMVVGEHPFAGDGGDEVADRIREQRSSGGGRPTAGSATSGPVAVFAASVLAAPRSARPTTARALANRLGEVAST